MSLQTIHIQYSLYLFILSISNQNYSTLFLLSLQRGPVAAGEGHAGYLVILVRHRHLHLSQLGQVLLAVAQGLLKLELTEVALDVNHHLILWRHEEQSIPGILRGRSPAWLSLPG